MSLHENTFGNPFKNWPFPTSAIRSGLHHACNCPLDLDGLPISPDGHECVSGFMHGYPIGFAPINPPPREIPSVRISRPDDDAPKPAGRQTAIDSLRANSLKLKSRPRVEQMADRLAPGRNTNSGSVSHAPSNKENVGRRPSSKGTSSHENTNINTRGSRAPMQPVVNRSVSISTSNSELTNHSWQSAMTSDSQTTMSPGDSAERNKKGKQPAAWSYNSPESTPESVYGAKAPVSGGAITSSRDHQHRGQHKSASQYGKMVLGCSQCLFDPKLQVAPCRCLICIDCGGRFWSTISSTNNEVFCGCGERVSSLISLDQAYVGQTVMASPAASSPYTPSNIYSPASVGASPSSSTAAVHFTSPTPVSRFQPSPLKMDDMVPFLPTIPPIQFSGIQPVVHARPMSTNKLLAMDAETAMRNAPFVDLGRNSLPQNWSCVKIGNIPYNVTSEELLDFLGRNSNIVTEVAGSIGIHVIMDRSTGKTMDAYVEFMNAKDAWKCVSRRRSRVLGNRHLSLDVVDPSELMKDIFPRAKGIIWEGVMPVPAANKPEYGSKTEIISREELVLIVNHARTPHRSPFSRKCLQRPFQSLMSIVSKFPWFAVDLYTIEQRDYIYQSLLTAVDILKRQIKRGRTLPNLDLELLKTLLCVGLRCSGFTDAQKYELVKTAEFGAEGIRVDSDIAVLGGFEALGKAIGAERKVLEFYSVLLELSITPRADEHGSQMHAAAELIRAKNITKQHPEESKKSHLTMAEASAVEWNIIQKAIMKVLPSKHFAQDSQQMSNTANSSQAMQNE